MKRLARRRVDEAPLREVMELIVQDTPESARELARRHGAHPLRGEWQGSFECHIANAGDWLLIWAVRDGVAYFQRTGTHDELFRG